MPSIASRILLTLSGSSRQRVFPAHVIAGRRFGGYRYVSIQVSPSTASARITASSQSIAATTPDVTFEVLGQPYSLLSVLLAPSQDLYTRRGTLVGLTNPGDDDAVTSSLRLIGPVRRAPLGIPFLYQKITSTTPVSAVIAPKSPITSFAILQLDGRTDWRIAQRKALLAWSGKSLRITPTINQSLHVAHWANSSITGRGLVALAGQGQIFTVEVGSGESYIAHPAHVLAYSTSSPSQAHTSRPLPWRFRSSSLRLTIPLPLGNWFPQSNFIRNLKTSGTYRFFYNVFLKIRTWSRRTIWGDRLFLKFEGPTTLLIQSRGSQLRELLSNREIDEIADGQSGRVQDRLYEIKQAEEDRNRMGIQGGMIGAASSEAEERSALARTTTQESHVNNSQNTKLRVRSVSEDGKATFEARRETK